MTLQSENQKKPRDIRARFFSIQRIRLANGCSADLSAVVETEALSLLDRVY